MVPTSFVISLRLCCGAGCACAVLAGAANQFQSAHQPGEELAQFTLVVIGQGSQQAMALRRDVQDNAAAIGGVVPAMDQPGFFTALAEFDDAVMAQA
jgi:hypothetical protein